MVRLLLDLDGVICEYDFPKIVKNFFGIDLRTKMIYAYDLADVLGVAPLMINTMFREQVYGKPRFNKGAIETLTEWNGQHEIVIYSNRVKYMGEMGLAEWLIRNEIPFNGIDVEGTGHYDYHIDDCPSKLMSTKSTLKLLYSQPWNIKCLDIMRALKRVRNWQEIKEMVEEGVEL